MYISFGASERILPFSGDKNAISVCDKAERGMKITNNKDIIFFDNNGSILKFDKKSKLIWKKNYYSKSEKKSSKF